MSVTRPRLTIMTIFSFLCVLVFAVSSSVQADSGEMIDLKGTGSAGSFSYGEDPAKKGSAIGYGVNHRKSEGSKSKSYTHGSKVYSGHISGSNSHKKQEGSQSKSYSHGKPGHGKSNYGTKSGHGKSYGHKKSEGSQSKSYSHGKPGHGKSSHAYKGGYGKSYGHKKGSHGNHGGHGSSPFKHVMNYKYKLGLTDAQIQAMKELDVDFKKKIVQAKADHEIAHMELDLHVHSGKVDESKIRDAGAKIVASKTNKIMAMIDAKIQLLNLLTAEQRQKMAKMH
jgi:Spy/CpxP family protein refolding chaperone